MNEIIARGNLGEFRKNIVTELIHMPQSNDGYYWSDYPPTVMDKRRGHNWSDNLFMYGVVYLNINGNQINNQKPINIQYSIMRAEEKKLIIKLLEKYVPGQYTWDGKNTSAIRVHYDKINNPKINMLKLKDDDTYPYVMLSVDFPKSVDLSYDRSPMEQIVYYVLKKILHKTENDVSVDDQYSSNDATLTFYSVDFINENKLHTELQNFLDGLKSKKAIVKYRLYYEDGTAKPIKKKRKR